MTGQASPGPQRGPASVPQINAQVKQSRRESLACPTCGHLDPLVAMEADEHLAASEPVAEPVATARKPAGTCATGVVHNTLVRNYLTSRTDDEISLSNERNNTLHALAERDRQLADKQHEIEQILGKALGYPVIHVDAEGSVVAEGSPGAVGTGDICVGDNVPASLATEAADKIERLTAALAAAEGLAATAEATCAAYRHWLVTESGWENFREEYGLGNTVCAENAKKLRDWLAANNVENVGRNWFESLRQSESAREAAERERDELRDREAVAKKHITEALGLCDATAQWSLIITTLRARLATAAEVKQGPCELGEGFWAVFMFVNGRWRVPEFAAEGYFIQSSQIAIRLPAKPE